MDIPGALCSATTVFGGYENLMTEVSRTAPGWRVVAEIVAVRSPSGCSRLSMHGELSSPGWFILTISHIVMLKDARTVYKVPN